MPDGRGTKRTGRIDPVAETVPDRRRTNGTGNEDQNQQPKKTK